MKQYFGRLRRLGAGVLAAGTLLCAAPMAAADEETTETPQQPEIYAGAGVVYEANTGTVLYDKDGLGQYYPASTTKILTALIAIERLDMDETIEFTDDVISAVADEARHYEVQPGEAMSVHSCLQMLLIPSVNEAADAIAFRIGGSEEGFAKLMNAKAAQLGATGCHFVTPNGLQDSEHYVTAYGMTQILTECAKQPVFREIAGSPSCTITDARLRDYEYVTTTCMLETGAETAKDWVVCSKTGRTWYAGCALMTYAKKGNMELACALLGNTEYILNGWDTVDLCEYCFANYDVYDGTTAVEKRVLEALGRNTEVRVGNAYALITPEMPVGGVTTEIETLRYLGVGEFAGTAVMTLPDGSTKTVPFEVYAG